jgi:hypothetical protein
MHINFNMSYKKSSSGNIYLKSTGRYDLLDVMLNYAFLVPFVSAYLRWWFFSSVFDVHDDLYKSKYVLIYDKIKFAVVTKETPIFSTELNHKAQRYASTEDTFIRDIFNEAASISGHTDETQRRFWHLL